MQVWTVARGRRRGASGSPSGRRRREAVSTPVRSSFMTRSRTWRPRSARARGRGSPWRRRPHPSAMCTALLRGPRRDLTEARRSARPGMTASSLLTTHSPLPPTSYSYFLPPTSYFLLPTSYFLLPTSYFLLPTSYFLLPTSYFLLPTSYFLLPTSYFLLPTPHFLLPTPTHSPLPTPHSLPPYSPFPSVSSNRTTSPRDGASSVPSHMTMLPRTMVPTGQPVTVTPS